MERNIKIVIADDHPVFRSGLKTIVLRSPELEVIGEAVNGLNALSLIKECEPDVAVLDVNMPKASGFDVARELQNSNLATEIIILTMHKDEAMFNSAMDLGIKGYLLKESAVEDIVNGIKAVAKGENFINSSLSTYLFNRSRRNANLQENKPTINDLTPTQLIVLRLIAQEKTSQQIADELFISIRTVQRHRENICNKMSLRGSNVLLKFALANKETLF